MVGRPLRAATPAAPAGREPPDSMGILFITTLTGVGGLALGGCLAAAVHSPSDRAVSLLLQKMIVPGGKL